MICSYKSHSKRSDTFLILDKTNLHICFRIFTNVAWNVYEAQYIKCEKMLALMSLLVGKSLVGYNIFI